MTLCVVWASSADHGGTETTERTEGAATPRATAGVEARGAPFRATEWHECR